jgi:hypothetical protein
MDMEVTIPRRAVNERDVWTAADALLLEGRRPTIESVRLKIGRGSPNTITPYLDTWFKGLGRRLQDPGAFASAAAIPDPVAVAAVHFWETALAAARGEVEARVAAEWQALAGERDDVGRAREQLAQEETTFQARRQALDETVTLAKEQLAQAMRRAETAEARTQSAEARSASLDRELRAVRATLDAERTASTQEREQTAPECADDRARHEAAERRWLGEVDRARGETAKAAKQLAEQGARRQVAEEAARARHESLEEALATTRRELRTAEREIARLQAQGVLSKVPPHSAASRAKVPRGPRTASARRKVP